MFKMNFSKEKRISERDKNALIDALQGIKENNLDVEFGELHFLKKENGIEELKKLGNPKRNYLIPLLKIDMKGE